MFIISYLQSTAEETKTDIVPLIFTLLGALLGSIITMFSPFVSNLVASRERKKTLKHNIFKYIHLYHNYKNIQINHINNCYYHNSASNYFNENDESQKSDLHFKQSEKYESQFKDDYSKVTELEAELLSYVYEIGDVYNQKTFTLIYGLTKPIFENLEDNEFFDYDNKSLLK